MSLFALMPSVRDAIRTTMKLRNEECRIMPGPKPPPSCGDRFVSIFGLEWAPGDPDIMRGIDEYYGVGVCISMRTAYLQFDDQGEEAYVRVGAGLEALTRRINTIVHQSIPIMQAANSLLGNPTNGIIEPLKWIGSDPNPTEVDDTWFGGVKGAEPTIAGLTMQTNFGRAHRPQTYENMVASNGN